MKLALAYILGMATTRMAPVTVAARASCLCGGGGGTIQATEADRQLR